MLVYLVISVVVAIVLALVKTKRSHFIFGFIILILGIVTLYYSYFGKKPQIEDYVNQQIIYTKFWFDRNENAVILQSDCCKYILGSGLIRESSTTVDEVMNALKSNSEVKVWYFNTNYKDRKIIRGLELQTLQIPITTGMAFDDVSNYSFIGWLFIILGSIILILTLIFGDLIVSYAF